MTILVFHLGDTVIRQLQQGTFRLADLTMLPREGACRGMLKGYPILLAWLQGRRTNREEKERIAEGFQVGPEPGTRLPTPSIDELAVGVSRAELARRLPLAIRRIADDVRNEPKRRYAFEERMEITRLICFTPRQDENGGSKVDEGDDLIEWDWIREDSPMMSKGSDVELILDRLCESMNRCVKQVTQPSMTEMDTASKPPLIDNETSVVRFRNTVVPRRSSASHF
ncbi:hypothetical protein B0A50_02769 [Salinomyces thailandicus]|uniref:Uncharacterized protein n=1 Tax=Salinomyces thailandicus TaxID=706561 RepID=A0A4U0U4K5_9PEZI|nr:hypothetical protein B0A50_02769 [Salinomyces thailandica]